MIPTPPANVPDPVVVDVDAVVFVTRNPPAIYAEPPIPNPPTNVAAPVSNDVDSIVLVDLRAPTTLRTVLQVTPTLFTVNDDGPHVSDTFPTDLAISATSPDAFITADPPAPDPVLNVSVPVSSDVDITEFTGSVNAPCDGEVGLPMTNDDAIYTGWTLEEWNTVVPLFGLMDSPVSVGLITPT